jgi:endonuclease YncB( thermonuclease family)
MREYPAKITRIIDADTYEATVDLGFHASMDIKIRLLDIDAPEIRGSERVAGMEALRFANNLISEKAFAIDTEWHVTIITHKLDSFGRWLANIVFHDGVDLADELIKSGHAVKY